MLNQSHQSINEIIFKNEWMYVWTLMIGWPYKCEWMDEQMNMNEWMDEQMNMNEWMDEQIEWMNEWILMKEYLSSPGDHQFSPSYHSPKYFRLTRLFNQ